MNVRIAWLLYVLLLADVAGAATPDFDPARVAWRSLRMEASSFGLRATSSVALEFPGATAPRPALLDAPGAVAGGTELVRLNYRTTVLGQRFDTTLWLDARSGAALQYDTLESGRSPRYRTYRFADTGAHLWTRRPVDDESGRPSEQWSDRSQGFRPFPEAARGQVVIDPIALLYILAAADFNARGDQVQLFAMTGREVSRVQLRVDEPVGTRADFMLTRGTARQRCRGTWQATTISMSVVPLAGGDPDFDFLGLQSDIHVFMDRASHLPLAISGRAKLVGHLTIRLKEATLVKGSGCPA